MATRYRTYRFALRPTKLQEALFTRIAGACRFFAVCELELIESTEDSEEARCLTSSRM